MTFGEQQPFECDESFDDQDLIYECYKKKVWNAKKSVLPSTAMGDIDYSSSDDESSLDDGNNWFSKEAFQRSLEHNFLEKSVSPRDSGFLNDDFD